MGSVAATTRNWLQPSGTVHSNWVEWVKNLTAHIHKHTHTHTLVRKNLQGRKSKIMQKMIISHLFYAFMPLRKQPSQSCKPQRVVFACRYWHKKHKNICTSDFGVGLWSIWQEGCVIGLKAADISKAWLGFTLQSRCTLLKVTKGKRTFLFLCP